MEKNFRNAEFTERETAAMSAFFSVLWDDPQAARRTLANASFRDRALIVAWAAELKRLGIEEQGRAESRERRAWRDVMDEPLSTL